jgi:hypothetical protein
MEINAHTPLNSSDVILGFEESVAITFCSNLNAVKSMTDVSAKQTQLILIIISSCVVLGTGLFKCDEMFLELKKNIPQGATYKALNAECFLEA